MQPTPIEWCDFTSNPVKARQRTTGKVGWHCVKISTGCAHCYAEKINARFGTGLPYNREASAKVDLFASVKELKAIEKRQKPTRIFMGDMTDLFQEDVTFEMLDAIMQTVFVCPQHTFIFLTKRAQRMHDYFQSVYMRIGHIQWNVWGMVSVENQETADERIPWLIKTPLFVRGLSVEPLLAPIDLALESQYRNRLLHWTIVGGEIGPGSRPCDIVDVRDIVDQCQSQHIPVFVKQLGAKPVGDWGETAASPSWDKDGAWRLKSRKGADPSEWPEDLRVREFPDRRVSSLP